MIHGHAPFLFPLRSRGFHSPDEQEFPDGHPMIIGSGITFMLCRKPVCHAVKTGISFEKWFPLQI